jgi:DNA-binding HxlR family transcriptional regulator
MLIQTLHNLERDGLVERTVYQQVPPKTEYRSKGTQPTKGRHRRKADLHPVRN